MNSITIKIKTFLYSSLSGLKINFGGQLGFNEILALSDSLNIKSWKKLYRDVPAIKKLNIAYLVFLLAQITSDMVNRSAPGDFIRGWANIIVAIVVTNFLARMFWQRNNAILFYLFGIILSTIFFGPDMEGTSGEDMGFIKFKLMPILNSSMMVIAMLVLSKARVARRGVAILMVMYAAFCVASDARSNGFIFLIISVLLYKKDVFERLSFRRILPYLLVLVLLGQLVYSYYVSQVLAGKLGGKHAREQFEHTENPYNPLSLLMAGRSEVYVGMIAAMDKPLFGHGSWATDPGGKYNLISYRMHQDEQRFEDLLATGRVFYIPSHSVIFGAWVSAGLGGLFAILYIIRLFYGKIGVLLRSRIVRDSSYFPIILLYTIAAFWTFLFSPLPHIKQTLPAILSFIMVLARKVELRNMNSMQKLRQIVKERKEEVRAKQDLATS